MCGPAVPTFFGHMARPSKSHQFTIFEDHNIPSPDASVQPSASGKTLEQCGNDTALLNGKNQVRGAEVETSSCGGEPEDEQETNAEQELSLEAARTSISSLPDSVYETEDEYESWRMHKPYRPPFMRPAFRRPSSVRRMQMTSPAPSRHSTRSNSRIKVGTLPSVRPVVLQGSPRPNRRIHEEAEQESGSKHYPLVLLHITVLPINLEWSTQAMQELLPEETLNNLDMLRFKISETILRRGLLIPHPREEYELLEEHLLEALELAEERVTKCGHFCVRRDSIGSKSTAGDSDSGCGSSIGGAEVEEHRCTTCRQPLRKQNAGIMVSGRRWSIKVYAANGLMTSSAWATAWSDLERVDVEIMPWIGEEMVKSLNTRRQKENEAEIVRQEGVNERIRAVVEEQLRLLSAQSNEQHTQLIERTGHGQSSSCPSMPMQSFNTEKIVGVSTDYPPIYRSAEIPIQVLLRNYLILLAQDSRNVAIFFLAVLALWLGLHCLSLANPPPTVCLQNQISSVLLDDLTLNSSSPVNISNVGVRGDQIVEGIAASQNQSSVFLGIDVEDQKAGTLMMGHDESFVYELGEGLQHTDMESVGSQEPETVGHADSTVSNIATLEN